VKYIQISGRKNVNVYILLITLKRFSLDLFPEYTV